MPTNLSILPPMKPSKFPRSWFSFLSILYCHALLIISSLPRAARTLVWVMQAAFTYTWFQWRHRRENQASAAYQDAFSELHNRCAVKLLRVQLEHKLATELNFLNEIHNARKLAAILQGRQYRECSAPYMYEELSSPRLIIMEWVNGVKINDIQALQALGIEPKAVGWALVKVFAELMLIQGYIHGDPHPGNAMVRRRGRRGFWHWLLRDKRQPFEIVMLDHGTYFTADTVMRQQLCQLWCSFVLGDKQLQAASHDLMEQLLRICTCTHGVQEHILHASWVHTHCTRHAGRLPYFLHAQHADTSGTLMPSASIRIGFCIPFAACAQTASRDLVELLRINTVVRAVSNQLGVTMDERKRVFAWFARRGLPPYYVHAPHIHHKFNQVRRRLQLCTYVLGWHALVTTRACLVATWRYMLGLMHDVL
ncbi:hypothetical protein DUNSADRAFT_1655 [Dunaliella salina]|nr:hypothetical protein DUNSADRAFT_1655 [Dunaliella salina]|eukprot:KAF5826968.1 hypothetical protein DUNSADRAFT_1655 [Dunaliella salina]